MNTTAENFLRLVKIMDELREQCPWDKKQTIHTLRPMTIEEVYELCEAIINEDWNNIKEELGDVLLHILFYSRIAKEENKFDIHDVINTICEKLIIRHPHIYGNVKVENEDDVKRNWEKIKIKEGAKESVLSGVPKTLPAVIKATRMQEKVKQVGFEWSNKEDVWKKVEEEMGELKEAIKSNKQEHIEEEFGDILFSLINYARFLKVDAEGALEKTNQKFLQRFQSLELIAKEKGKILSEMSLAEMDEIWNDIKKSKH
ncbi:MAG: nucleoside triphosphate pyrophosphohydrolase [Chitinophagaceae bacterium]|nr:nucleoside triphosphate pyrophosphohydrolase [Chitinophagaceae bacterium]MCW5906053.1 nucleoside triphosphate pyrophosphohydrolase [Chitinophagaceae bacterium]